MDETLSVGQGSSYAGVSPFKGFWIRWLAAIIDGLILIGITAVFLVIIVAIAGILLGEVGAFVIFLLALAGFSIALLLYKPLMEGSEFQGTFGKYFLGMKIVNQRGERIDMTTSFVRSIVYLILGAIFVGVLGILMIGFTERKQGLHDVAAKTFVVSQHWSGPIPVPQDGFGA